MIILLSSDLHLVYVDMHSDTHLEHVFKQFLHLYIYHFNKIVLPKSSFFSSFEASLSPQNKEVRSFICCNCSKYISFEFLRNQSDTSTFSMFLLCLGLL